MDKRPLLAGALPLLASAHVAIAQSLSEHQHNASALCLVSFDRLSWLPVDELSPIKTLDELDVGANTFQVGQGSVHSVPAVVVHVASSSRALPLLGGLNPKHATSNDLCCCCVCIHSILAQVEGFAQLRASGRAAVQQLLSAIAASGHGVVQHTRGRTSQEGCMSMGGASSVGTGAGGASVGSTSGASPVGWLVGRGSNGSIGSTRSSSPLRGQQHDAAVAAGSGSGIFSSSMKGGGSSRSTSPFGGRGQGQHPAAAGGVKWSDEPAEAAGVVASNSPALSASFSSSHVAAQPSVHFEAGPSCSNNIPAATAAAAVPAHSHALVQFNTGDQDPAGAPVTAAQPDPAPLTPATAAPAAAPQPGAPPSAVSEAVAAAVAASPPAAAAAAVTAPASPAAAAHSSSTNAAIEPQPQQPPAAADKSNVDPSSKPSAAKAPSTKQPPPKQQAGVKKAAQPPLRSREQAVKQQPTPPPVTTAPVEGASQPAAAVQQPTEATGKKAGKEKAGRNVVAPGKLQHPKSAPGAAAASAPAASVAAAAAVGRSAGSQKQGPNAAVLAPTSAAGGLRSLKQPQQPQPKAAKLELPFNWDKIAVMDIPRVVRSMCQSPPLPPPPPAAEGGIGGVARPQARARFGRVIKQSANGLALIEQHLRSGGQE